MNQHEQTELLQEARLFALAAPVILPLLEKRKKVALEMLQADFRQGKTDNLARVAEITCLGDLEREIRQKEAIYNTMEKRK